MNVVMQQKWLCAWIMCTQILIQMTEEKVEKSPFVLLSALRDMLFFNSSYDIKKK